jgi:hypothetical protein
MEPLPSSFTTTREAVRAVACYAIGPARRARDGHIWLAPSRGGIGLPPSGAGPWIGIVGDRLVAPPGADVRLTTLRAAAEAVGVALDADPGVGHDLPPFEPDAELAVDEAASLALGRWYAYGADVHAELAARHAVAAAAGPPKLWPEHFDLAATVDRDGRRANVGASAGDAHDPAPYLYVGPWDLGLLAGDPFWDAPFGATLGYAAISRAVDPVLAGVSFVEDGLRRLGVIA